MNHGEPGHHQIIIIKRGNEEEEGHHGGAWKIAFADFMTAMMALFLVLWLINAANEETKRAVASYFNPVKLVDRNRSSKGVNDQRGGPTSDPNESGNLKSETDPSASNPDQVSKEAPKDSKTDSEAQFFSAPQEQLDAIQQAALDAQAAIGAVPAQQPDSALDNFADPFGPDFWNQTKSEPGGKSPMESKPESPSEKTSAAVYKNDAGKAAAIGKQEQPETLPESTNDKSPEHAKEELAKQLKSEVKKALEGTVDNADQINSTIEVKSTDDGILISVTDTLGHPMFEIGSAVPAAPLVFAVDAIAKTLAGQTGPVHVFGHTDAREYKNVADGNWRLSTDRAKSTYFMLIHGGLSDRRIVEIAGFADRKLRAPGDPLADENRRIEILLESK